MIRRISIWGLVICGAWITRAQSDTLLYSFFTAGHTYGNPNSYTPGLHEPFVDYIPQLNADPKMALGVFTGDMVPSPTAAYWDSAQLDLDLLAIPYYIAAGNHDRGPEFVNRFGPYYHSFMQGEDLFIILNPDQGWNIAGAQLAFLQNTLDSNSASARHIFIFLHELIWWSPTNEYADVQINWEPHYPGPTNFDSVVKPLLLSYPNDITIYAGDVGCTNQVSPLMYHHFDNLTLIASGMGSGTKDNLIITEVYADSVHYELVALNGPNPGAMGDVEDYSMLGPGSTPPGDSLRLYPNPVTDDLLIVENGLHSPVKLKLYNSQGQLVHSQEIPQESIGQVITSGLANGVYTVHLQSGETTSLRRISVQRK